MLQPAVAVSYFLTEYIPPSRPTLLLTKLGRADLSHLASLCWSDFHQQTSDNSKRNILQAISADFETHLGLFIPRDQLAVLQIVQTETGN